MERRKFLSLPAEATLQDARLAQRHLRLPEFSGFFCFYGLRFFVFYCQEEGGGTTSSDTTKLRKLPLSWIGLVCTREEWHLELRREEGDISQLLRGGRMDGGVGLGGLDDFGAGT